MSAHQPPVDVATQPLLIGGEWREASTGAVHEVRNAYSGEVVTRQAAASVADADAALAAAAGAAEAWAASAPADRHALLTRAADVLEARGPEIAATMSAETSGTFGWGMFNVGLSAAIMRAAAELALAPTREPVATAIPGLESLCVREPLGVCVGIAPWNAPVILGTRAVVWPLALGNTVVLKASEQSPRVHAAIIAALVEAGAPDGVVNLLTNDPADAGTVVGALIDSPHSAHINFTGSTRVGTVIATRAAPLLKRTLLELGGKAPLVVLDDADLEAAAGAASFGAFMNSGQICMSTERIVVDAAVHDRFVGMLAERAEALVTGDPHDPETMVGPMVSPDAARRLQELLDDARAQGAQVVAGGTGSGALWRPTVVTGVTPSMRLYGEESFGPVVVVVEAADERDAVRLANDTEYGLSAAVFGADEGRALRVAGQIRSGICHVNGATVHDEAAAPFGGVKASGWGRFGAGEVMREFTATRWITVSREPRHYPI